MDLRPDLIAEKTDYYTPKNQLEELQIELDKLPELTTTQDVLQLLKQPHLTIESEGLERVILSYDCTFEVEHGIAVAFNHWKVEECDWAAHLL